MIYNFFFHYLFFFFYFFSPFWMRTEALVSLFLAMTGTLFLVMTTYAFFWCARTEASASETPRLKNAFVFFRSFLWVALAPVFFLLYGGMFFYLFINFRCWVKGSRGGAHKGCTQKGSKKGWVKNKGCTKALFFYLLLFFRGCP